MASAIPFSVFFITYIQLLTDNLFCFRIKYVNLVHIRHKSYLVVCSYVIFCRILELRIGKMHRTDVKSNKQRNNT